MFQALSQLQALSAVVNALPPVRIVNLDQATLATKIAVQVCVGLANRDPSIAGGAYTLCAPAPASEGGTNAICDARDALWLDTATDAAAQHRVNTSIPDFLTTCLSGASPLAKGYIKYNASDYLIIPNLCTLAAVLDAVPLEASSPYIGTTKAPQVFDALTTWAEFKAFQATEWMADRYLNKTRGMAKMNPGLDVHGGNPFNPKLTSTPEAGLIDYIVKAKLFNFFLNDGCIPLTRDHALFERIVKENAWHKPIAVMGYDDTWAIAGDLFEAETTCASQFDLGQIASNGCSNLAFFSNPNREPITEAQPLAQPPSPRVEYNTSKRYLAIVVGDGDNINFIKGTYDYLEYVLTH